MALSKTGDYLATGTGDGKLTLWSFLPPTTTATVTRTTTPLPPPPTTVTTLPVTTIPTPLPTGTLQVSSVPAGAEIYVDGVDVGKTPADLTGIPAGIHAITLVLNGYNEERMEVTVPASGTTSVAANLTPGALPPMGSPLFLVVVAVILLALAALVVAGVYFFRKR